MRIKVFYHESVEKLDRKERNVVKREVRSNLAAVACALILSTVN